METDLLDINLDTIMAEKGIYKSPWILNTSEENKYKWQQIANF